jgi:hypothetical protein
MTARISSLIGVWLPFLAYAVLTTAFFIRTARRVPDPGKSSWLGAGIDAVVNALAKRLPWRATA